MCRTAFITRLVITRDSPTGSAVTASPCSTLPPSRTDRARAIGSAPAIASLTMSVSATVSGLRVRTPAWIRDSSNRSSTIRTIRSTSARIWRW